MTAVTEYCPFYYGREPGPMLRCQLCGVLIALVDRDQHTDWHVSLQAAGLPSDV